MIYIFTDLSPGLSVGIAACSLLVITAVIMSVVYKIRNVNITTDEMVSDAVSLLSIKLASPFPCSIYKWCWTFRLTEKFDALFCKRPISNPNC